MGGARPWACAQGSVALLLCIGGLVQAQHLPRPLVVNVDHRGLPLQPSFDLHPDGRPRFVWNTYRNHQERLYTTVFENGRRSRTQELGAGAGVYWMPQFVADGDDGWAVWQERKGGGWRVVSRRLENELWAPIEILGRNTLTHSATVHEGKLAVVWEDHAEGAQRIVYRKHDGSKAQISQPGKACYRPSLAAHQEALIAVWDCYEGREYSVYTRAIEPEIGPIDKASGSSNAMGGFALLDSSIAVFYWVAENDVLGKGALDQRHRLEVGGVHHGTWQEPHKLADLSHGLLSRIEPEVEAIWGYAGRRLHPMLVTDGGILWERKAMHSGRSTEPGQLVTLRVNDEDDERLELIILHEGLVGYQVPSSAGPRDGKLTIAGFDSTHNLVALQIGLEEIDLEAAKPVEPTTLTGWEPVKLPLPHWKPPKRPSIEIDGVTHKLYWGDLHVHTTLTADAEGEVDELMHFARDKALLDVVVMQENDAASWLNSNAQGAYRGQVLTDSEYALSVYFSRRYTEEGDFIALPGWEWSDRTDDKKSNHRTVIFAGDHTPLLRHSEEDDFDALCDMVEAAGGLMNSQHPDFRLVDRPCDANIEVTAGWGVYINEPEKIHADLSAGFKVGFVGTSDGHRRNPGIGGGLTGFWAPSLTSEAMLAALKDHRVYATNGTRTVLDARANGSFMGQDVESDGEVELTLRVDAQRPIVRAVLLRDGDEIYVVDGEGNSLATGHVDRVGAGFHWYYWRIELEGESPNYPGNIKVAEGHLAWTSPHRVQVR